MQRTINHFWLGTLIVFAVHNLEETIAVANGWTTQHVPSMQWGAVQWPLFAMAASTITLLVGFIAWYFRKRPERSALWLQLFLGIMLLNAVWHVGVSVYTQSLAPGVVTSVLLMIPLYASVLYKLFQMRRVA